LLIVGAMKMLGRPISWIRQGARRLLAVALPRRLFVVRGPRRQQQVCLTFDDGPHPEFTPKMLDLLSELGVPATFFVIGREAERYPELVRRMAAEGHAVGNHSQTHPARESLTAGETAEEVSRCSRAIAEITGRPPQLYRPPRGKVTARDLWRMWRSGITVVLWNVDPRDYARGTSAEVAEWFRCRHLHGGDIVLMHDNHPHALEVVPVLVRDARAAGYTFTTVEAWTR
jgi:peptidoglycan/xylan/chitin deacetylase (PgdA/CDA1 family)